MAGLSDHDLMLSVKNGNIDQLALLFERHHKKLYNLFLGQTRNPHVSEDLVQDVFVRILKYKHTYRGEGKFTTWMYSIARSAKADHFRKTKGTDSLDQVKNIPMDDLGTEDQLVKEDANKILHQALSRLSEEKKDVLLMSRFRHMKYEQIAEIMQCSVGTVKSRVFWAMKNLSKIYKQLSGENHEM